MNNPKPQQLILYSSLSLALLLAHSASGAVSGLINTGTDASGSLLADGSVQPGWSITSVNPANPPGGLTPTTPPSDAFVVAPHAFWLPNASGDPSKWISYSSPLYTGADVYREFVYQLSFQGSQGDSFYLRLAADNGTKVFLNQTTTDPLLDWSTLDTASFKAFGSWSPWIKVSDILNGNNELTCLVANLYGEGQNPTGLRVEFSLNAPQVDAVPVPEPSTVVAGLLLLLPLSLVGFRPRRTEGDQPQHDH